ncbi:hypothetical protein G7Z17_g1203 [Cylindrodendrum hubeiense]|uniref:Uncharacterized protein n=1 Tax=Cylindrodendrum hubeiense TaxID=595255 RepID=A0A9P5HIR4_9HYPO|nr:hypothetical protein G7Z17_g1203 [Cylindrodendrum hubeiense]
MSAPPSPRSNVMTSAKLEAYRKQRDEESDDSDGTEDDIDYDSEGDNKESKKQADQRRHQEAHIAGYRQQMMKTTNGPPQPIQHTRVPTLQGPWMDIPDYDDDDDDVPLAMLQAQRQRDQMSRLAGVRSNPNLRGTAQQQFSRPGSAQSQSRNNSSHLQLPSFARSLPQDPFQDPIPIGHNGSFQQPFSGGLVGVIASEERAKASRRGSPSGGFQPIPSPVNNPFELTNGPYQIGQMAYPNGMPGMQQSSRPQTATSGSQINLLQMSHALQAQAQFLQGMTWPGQHQTGQSWNQFPSQKPAENHGATAGGSGSAVPTYGGYAQSIPPSERSTVGLPSRYRPVSRPRN